MPGAAVKTHAAQAGRETEPGRGSVALFLLTPRPGVLSAEGRAFALLRVPLLLELREKRPRPSSRIRSLPCDV